VHEVPHPETLVLATHAVPQAWKPLPQVKPHAVPSQVAVELAGGVQAEHDVVPQLATAVLDTQVEPHTWKPELQAKPHVVPLQVAVAFVGAVHGVVQVVPQVIGLLFAWHELPQA
jgi:hypothetical protein